MNSAPTRNVEPVLSKRRLGVAGLAAVLGCAACCAFPLIAAAGLGGSAAAILGSVFRPGSELVVGAGIFLAALGVMTLGARRRQRATNTCGATCNSDGKCCDRGAASR